MTTARDLAIVALGATPEGPLEQGDLALALAGAEAVDLLAHGALALDGDRMVPRPGLVTDDRLLNRAAGSIVSHEPYETIEQWLWRRGSNLAAAYAEDLQRTGLIDRSRSRWRRPRFVRTAPDGPLERPCAEERTQSQEAVLTVLLDQLGLVDGHQAVDEDLFEDDVARVLAAVGDAVTQLEAARLKQDVERAAFDNMWRG
ncbi:GPP34 family phosphoprotein [Streptomyces dioscori]|uniref:GPP34 family phosphoprotein n=1 Tax=Streptomyces dioscori TaxID=2109333 RepID=A0A2P8Q9K5_9ACTN|nr:GPP34 family phosphoprotein [Streptomyces dioscori]PSM42930.1 GPP34 family phosphoprotein [Streptomyces dioscori]